MEKPKSYALTFKGRRDYNQDACTVLHHGNLIFLAVADGMGGHKGGEIASKTVINTCSEILAGVSYEKLKPQEMKAVLENMFSACQKNIKELSSGNTELMGMGTTLSCVLLMGDYYVWGNIGDSRVYHFNGSRLKQITVDHSYIEEYRKEHGDNIPEYVAARSNVITRSLSGDDDQPDIFPHHKHYEKLKWDEGFLICSDGLIVEKQNVSNSWMVDLITQHTTLKSAAEALIEHAYKSGSDDNISVVLYEHMDFERVKIETDDEFRTIPIDTSKLPDRKTNSNPEISGRSRIRRVSTWLFFFIVMLFALFFLMKNLNRWQIEFNPGIKKVPADTEKVAEDFTEGNNPVD